MTPQTMTAILVTVSILYICIMLALAYMVYWREGKARPVGRRVIQYVHHDRVVSVRANQRGKHRMHCLCYGCGKFTPDNAATQCPIAKATFDNCVKHGTVTPVWECPEFQDKDQPRRGWTDNGHWG